MNRLRMFGWAAAAVAIFGLAACNGDDINSIPEALDVGQQAPGGGGCVIPSGATTPFTVNYFDRGWWNDSGAHTPSLELPSVGWSIGAEYHAYVQWDLASLPGPVQSATLRLVLDTYNSADPSEDYSLWDVTTSSAVLDSSASGNVAVYNDLGDGAQYGALTVTAANLGKSVYATLSTDAICDMNDSLGGTFAIGIRGDSLVRVPGTNEQARFGDIASEVSDLQLQVVP